MSNSLSILPLDGDTVYAAAPLITDLRTAMNGKPVCSPSDVISVLLQSLREQTYHGFIAWNDYQPLGYVGLNNRYAIYAGGPFMQITELVVTEKARGQGVGTALLSHAEDFARSKEVFSIELGAPPYEGHDAAHAFYAARGYRKGGPKLSKSL